MDILEYTPNGDPCGSGYTGGLSVDGGLTWTYCGDLGARSLRWWRSYCHEHGYKLRKRTYD
jgi:hypothetical protein